MHHRFFIAFLGICSSISMPAQAQQELFKLVASDQVYFDQFGNSVAIDGDRALIGIMQGDVMNTAPGHVYLYDTTSGIELARWEASDAMAYDRFGWSVGLSDGVAIVSAPAATGGHIQSGAAYLIDVATGQELHKIFATDGYGGQAFGRSAAIDGDRAIVGADLDTYGNTLSNGTGAAYLFNVTTGAQTHRLEPDDIDHVDRFGESVAISGNRCIVGSPHDDDQGNSSGSAYIFDVTTGQQLFKLTGSQSADFTTFGTSVAISGDLAVVGAPITSSVGLGRAYVFDVNTGAELFELITADNAIGDRFGFGVALSGERAIVGAHGVGDPWNPFRGAAYLFDATTGAELFELTASDASATASLGFKVALDGDRAVIGANNDGTPMHLGAAYVFTTVGPGSSYCTAAPNSTGLGSEIQASGSSSLADASLSLHATNAPPGEPCIFYAGPIPLNTPFGDGLRCAGGSTLRLYPPVQESAGAYVKTVDFGVHGATLASMGTAYFQCWYRDPAAGGAGFNLSDGLELTFVP